jgi:hypothetical protein
MTVDGFGVFRNKEGTTYYGKFKNYYQVGMFKDKAQ